MQLLFFPASASVNVETQLIIIYLILKFFTWLAQEWVVVSRGSGFVEDGAHLPLAFCCLQKQQKCITVLLRYEAT